MIEKLIAENGDKKYKSSVENVFNTFLLDENEILVMIDELIESIKNKVVSERSDREKSILDSYKIDNNYLNEIMFIKKELNDIEIKNIEDLILLNKKIEDTNLYKFLNNKEGHRACSSYFRNLEIEHSLNNFINNLNLEEIDKEVENCVEEKKEFYEKYPLEKFKKLALEEWDNSSRGEYFVNYLENKTRFFGTGTLGTGKNRIFYYVKNTNSENQGKYEISKKIKEEYPGKTDNELFEIFRDKLVELIEIPISQIDKFDFGILNGANVISTKTYNFYSKTPTLSLNSKSYCEKIAKKLNIKVSDKSNLQIGYKIEKLFRSYDKLKSLDIENLNRVLWKYDSFTTEENDLEIVNKPTSSYKQIIYAGAPGTGKSRKVKDMLEDMLVDEKFISRVTFYPDFEYHDFVGSIMPITKDNQIKYEFAPGIFTTMLKKALNDKSNHYYLIIEEMTRGNCASIFGDIFQLLDRDDNGRSEYPIYNKNIKNFLMENNSDDIDVVIPSNLSIIGTVNTSDQNVFVMDSAFKRRFQFEYVSTKYKSAYDESLESVEFLDIKWKDLYEKINKFIIEDLSLSEDKQLGPFFIKENKQEQKVIMYLYEDVIGNYGNRDKLFKANTLIDALDCKDIKSLFSENFLNKNKLIDKEVSNDFTK